MVKRRKILWVINPNAGGGDHTEVYDILDEKGESSNIYSTTNSGDKEKIEKLLLQNKYDLVVVGGGDGTVKLVASCMENYPSSNIAILPLGSANGLATEMDVSAPNATLIESYLQEPLTSRGVDAIKINNHYCLHISDIGLNAKMIKEFENQSVRGFLGYGLGFLDALDTSEWTFSATINGSEVQTLMVFFANARKYGTGVTINPQGDINDGKFEVGFLKDLNATLIGQILFRPEKKPDKNWLHIESYERIELNLNRNIELQVDGEYIGTTDCIIAECIPSFICIQVP